MNVHESPPANGVVGWIANIVGPPETVAAFGAVDEHDERVQATRTRTGSLKVTDRAD